MSAKLDLLKDKLREMFQMDQAELDFGIYRIMNAKRDEVDRFLDADLLPTVRETLERFQPAGHAELHKQLEEAIAAAKKLKVDPDAVDDIRRMKAELASAASIGQLEEEVYSHLVTFFSRYYQGGDFLSLRRYKEGVYALPYEGEEVKLHWANADQYYIKSAENFRTYAFRVAGDRRVRFELVSAGTERDNSKAAADKERRFILCSSDPLTEDNGQLVIRIEYRPDEDKRSQKDLNAAAIVALLDLQDGAPATAKIADWTMWREALSAKAPTEKNASRTVLEKHLTDYTAKNSFDYFIHKDLGRFLRRELDFFIKNEVMFLDDIEDDTAPRVEQYLAKIKALRLIAHKITDFLAQLENFQKKLWLKKKLVLETNWLVTLDKVPQELYPTIATNDAQRREWVKLFAIDEIKGDLAGAIGYGEPLTAEFLKANPFLVLDTAFFDQQFKDTLLANFEDVDGEASGLLVHGENFQTLNLLQCRHSGEVKCVYIDPPYNTGGDGFLYKDAYQHSSWLSLMQDRITASMRILRNDGFITSSIDDREKANLRKLMENIIGASGSFVSDIAIVNNLKGRQDREHIATAHDSLLFFDIGEAESFGFKLNDEQLGDFDRVDEHGKRYQLRDLRRRGGDDRKEDRPQMHYPIYWDASERRASLDRSSLDQEEILPVRSDGTDGRWRWGPETTRNSLQILEAVYNQAKNKWGVAYRVYLENGDDERTKKPKSFWMSPDYSSDFAISELKSMVGDVGFSGPKSRILIQDILQHTTKANDVVIDFFAGTGTTGHAVIQLWREERGQRKVILVEAGDHFDNVLVKRIAKSLYSGAWKNQKPDRTKKALSCLFKVIRLETYEDALDNLVFTRTNGQNALLKQDKTLREDYLLRYMLDIESRGSLLDLARFEDPFNVKMTVTRNDETKQVTVDLVETFNYLLGLRVKTMERVRDVYEVVGTAPDGDRALVLWRNVHQVDNDALDEWFRKRGYNSRDMEFDLIYVNGDNNMENLRRADETWKVRLIEEAFHDLMFDTQGV